MGAAELVVVVMVAAVLVGGFAQSVTGFGFALVVAPACALALPGALVVGTVARLAVAVDALVLTSSHGDVDRGGLARLVAPGLCAVPVGFFLTRVVPVGALVAAGAVATLLVAAAVTFRTAASSWHRLTRSSTGVAGPPAARAAAARHTCGGRSAGTGSAVSVGFLAGVLGLTSGLSGPPVALHAMLGGRPLAASRGTMAAFFLVVDVAAVLVHPEAASVAEMLALSAAGLAGIVIGARARARLDDAVVHLAVVGLVMVCAMGAMIHCLW
jgi:uncharacterized membrane protein YfcA